MLTVRDYAAADCNALIELFCRSVREIASRDYTAPQILAWAPHIIDRDGFAERNLTRPTWLAEIGGGIAGFADLESTGHLDRMYVHPDFQRRGVASVLLEKVEASAKEQDIKLLYANVSLTAEPFFTRRGFGIVAVQTMHVRDQDFLNYRMEKPIAVD